MEAAALHGREGVSTPIEPARPSDLPEVIELLERTGLPVEGASEVVDAMVVARSAGRVVGAAGLELYTDGALLRSVVVDESARGHGLGRQLTDAALALAQARGATTVFLLTTTAERFFPKFGFAPIGRDEVPASVQTSVEFVSACPGSAVVMRRRVDDVS